MRLAGTSGSAKNRRNVRLAAPFACGARESAALRENVGVIRHGGWRSSRHRSTFAVLFRSIRHWRWLPPSAQRAENQRKQAAWLAALAHPAATLAARAAALARCVSGAWHRSAVDRRGGVARRRLAAKICSKIMAAAAAAYGGDKYRKANRKLGEMTEAALSGEIEALGGIRNQAAKMNCEKRLAAARRHLAAGRRVWRRRQSEK